MISTLDRAAEYLRSLYGYLKFNSAYGRYRGIYATPEQAIQALPKNQKVGYNHSDLAQEYKDTFSGAIGFYDYPMLFWLRELLQPGQTLFDFGGNIGNHFYSYEKYLTYPKDLNWIVCELPEIIAAGEALAKQTNRSELQFTSDFQTADGTDIFIASGSVQYVESLSQLLSKLEHKPKHLLIGRIPLCEGKPFVTLQNGGLTFYPVYVSNQDQFINALVDLGYQLGDRWKDPGEPCAVPFHPEFKSLSFSGLYFKRGR